MSVRGEWLITSVLRRSGYRKFRANVFTSQPEVTVGHFPTKLQFLRPNAKFSDFLSKQNWVAKNKPSLNFKSTWTMYNVQCSLSIFCFTQQRPESKWKRKIVWPNLKVFEKISFWSDVFSARILNVISTSAHTMYVYANIAVFVYMYCTKYLAWFYIIIETKVLKNNKKIFIVSFERTFKIFCKILLQIFHIKEIKFFKYFFYFAGKSLFTNWKQWAVCHLGLLRTCMLRHKWGHTVNNQYELETCFWSLFHISHWQLTDFKSSFILG